jgi:hypothetical protein
VKPGDDPFVDAAMWLCLSEPSLTIALPFFTNVDEVPEFIRSRSSGDGMAGSSDRIRKHVYDYGNGRYADRYADTFALIEIRGNTFKIQDSLFTSYEDHLEDWRHLPPEEAAYNMTNWTYEMHLYAKTSYDSIDIILGVEADNISEIETFQLLQNFPNPFNSSTIFPFRTTTVSDVSLEIYNVRGESVWQWQQNALPTGIHEIRYNGLDRRNHLLPTGMYLYTLTTNDSRTSRKMIFLR